MSGFTVFEGNCPRLVRRDAKYRVRSRQAGAVIELTYLSEGGERWLATTQEHPDLIKMVNDIKVGVGDAPNGPFYINEFGQVIVPVNSTPVVEYYLAGDYDLPLRFKFEGKVLSGEGVDLTGRPLEPGDIWVGPHPGILYRLMAGKRDIYYEVSPREGVSRKIRLSDVVGTDRAAQTADRIRSIKGWSGGKFYVNEWHEMFAPVKGVISTEYEYRYIGHLEDSDPWFDKPHRGRP